MWLNATLTIASGQADSPELDLSVIFPASRLSVIIIPPSTLPETVSVKVAKAIGSNYGALQSGGIDITLPAGKATSLDPLVSGAIKLSAGGNVAADRTFDIVASPIR